VARRRRIISLAIAAALTLTHTPTVHAQFGGVVYDPANYVQNFYTAVRSYTQIIRQAQQLRNEASMLINQGKHLAKLDLNSVNDLNRILDEIAYLNMQAENVAYDVNRTRQLIRENFPQTYEGMSEDQLMVQAEQQFQMSERAHSDAMLMQSKMVESLQQDRVLLGQLMNKSHNSVGELQATQSTNQLMGLLVKQSMQAQQMQVTQARAMSLESSRQLALEKESRARMKLFMGDPDSAYGGGTP
jgi:P-type conjugative transfer protein TrbJ